MSDEIAILGLEVETRVGVSDDERAKPQPVLLDVVIEADLAAAAEADDLAETIDYEAAVREIAAVAHSSEVRLLEALAERIARRLAALDGVRGVTVRAGKKNVPVSEKVTSISVRMRRTTLT